jgi:predicted small lipoprotein YifL
MKKKNKFLATTLLTALTVSCLTACGSKTTDLGTLETTDTEETTVQTDETFSEVSTDVSSAGTLNLISDNVEFAEGVTQYTIDSSDDYKITCTIDDGSDYEKEVTVTDEALIQALDIVKLYVIDSSDILDDSLLVDITKEMENSIFDYIVDITENSLDDLSDTDKDTAYNYYNGLTNKDLVDINEDGTLSAGEQLLTLVKFKYAPAWDKEMQELQ